MPRISRYVELTLTDFQKLDTNKTLCLMAVSPIEVHGPHLPLGTDVFIAEKLQSEYCKALMEYYPDYNCLILPPIYAGCDPLPIGGSIAIRAKTLESLLDDYVRSLSRQGFRYLIICDNHGGPSHQMALEAVAVRAWRRHRFAVINPFNEVFRKMVQHDEEFLKLVSLPPGECGDDADCHAGTNETSLMLATNKDLVKEYKDIPASEPPGLTGVPVIISWLAKTLSNIGFTNFGADLKHLANLLAWVNSPNMLPYLGAPGLATPEAGERMIKGHVSVTLKLAGKAISGQDHLVKPMLWSLRAVRK
ncbi:MAG: creatininase family protein [Desulfocucumaceae bacterium]